MNIIDEVDKILIDVEKPARYIGCELNSVVKDFSSQDFRMVISYPDLYDIGMSNLGIKIIYEILNQQDSCLCERVFHPAMDMAVKLKENNIPLYSLESKIAIKEFDVLGFSLQFELTYSNVLGILDLSDIPLFTKDRREDHPIIIAGGPCTFNPEPMSAFIDLFVIGEGEEAISDFSQKYIQFKKQGLKRNEIIEAFSKESGYYIPAIHSSQSQIKRFALSDINRYQSPLKPPIPFINVTHDVGQIEVSRGCTIGCRFCQAGMIYRPVRERSIENIINFTDELIKNTGYREVSLLSLSIADYSMLAELIQSLNNKYSSRGISFNFPSLRIDGFTLEIAEEINTVRKTGLTFAVEAGSEYIRNIINKRVDEDKLLDIVKNISELGWKKIKLYFMVGFPIEDYDGDEAEDIINLINRLLNVNKKLQINVTLGTFVPKSHTPFQWSPQLSIEESKEVIMKIIKGIPNRRVKFKSHPFKMSFIEGLMARGGREMSNLIYTAFQKGARFDGWDDQLKFSVWEEAIEEVELDIDSALYKNKKAGDDLPWQHIDCDVTEKYLLKEQSKSITTEETLDCREKCYDFCGVCDKEIKRLFEDGENLTIPDYQAFSLDKAKDDRVRNVRLAFAKKDMLKYLGHLEMMYVFQKAFLRMKLNIVFTQGFNPIPKMEFANPLSLGIESEKEYLQFKVTGPLPDNFVDELNKYLPYGILALDYYAAETKFPKLQAQINKLDYSLKLNDLSGEQTEKALDKLNTAHEIPSSRKNKRGIYTHKRKCIYEAKMINQNQLFISFEPNETAANLMDYLQFMFELSREELIKMGITRKAQWVYEKTGEVDPLSYLAKEKNLVH